MKLVLFDMVSTFPGARFPWEALVKICKETDVVCLVHRARGTERIYLC